MAKKNGTLKLILSLAGLIIVLLGAAVGYGILQGDVADNSEDITTIVTALDANIAADHIRDLDIVGLKKDLEYLRQAADDQKIDVENHKVLLEEILSQVTK